MVYLDVSLGHGVEDIRDMCNAKGVLHDGCKVFLIDE